MRPAPRIHAFLTSLALCLTLVALAVVMTGCKSGGKPDPETTPIGRASSHVCRCGERTTTP